MTNKVVLTGVINNNESLNTYMFGDIPCVIVNIETTNQKGDKPRIVPILLMGNEAQEFKRCYSNFINLVCVFTGEVIYLYREQKTHILIHKVIPIKQKDV